MTTEVTIVNEQLNIFWVQDFIVNQSFYNDYSYVYISGDDTVFKFQVEIDAATVSEVEFFASLNSPTYVRPIQEEEEEASIEKATSIAEGIAQGVTQGLLAEDGQIGKTV